MFVSSASITLAAHYDAFATSEVRAISQSIRMDVNAVSDEGRVWCSVAAEIPKSHYLTHFGHKSQRNCKVSLEF